MGPGTEAWTPAAWFSCILHLVVIREIFSVAVTDVRLLSDSNQSKYALHGEGATLTCHYALEPSENVSEVEWEKDGILVYLWSLDAPPRAMNVLKDRVDLSNNSPSTITIIRVHMDMEGTYTCRVRTNGKTAQNDVYVMVIVDACYDSAWKTHSDMINCVETVSMHCMGIYPKPSPACGVYSELTGKYLNSVPFDSSNLLYNRTYEVSFNRRFIVEDWINHTDISFRCYMIVQGTPWRSGIKHQLFGDPGCQMRPNIIPNGNYNMSEEKSCWRFPREGAWLVYYCDEGYELKGPSFFTCRNGAWIPEDIIADYYPTTTCGKSGATIPLLVHHVIILLFVTVMKTRF